MIISVIPYTSAIKTNLVKNRNIVVIDVLRAGSVMITALAHGANAFIPARSADEALRISAGMPNKSYLLGGERDTKIINGFSLGNSPLGYTTEVVKNKTIILATSNGTKALNALQGTKRVFIGAFLNLSALVEQLINLEDIVLVCSGTNDNFSMDDAMCAAMIINRIMERKKADLSDMALTLQMAFHNGSHNLRKLLNDCYHLNLLVRNGFEEDVDYCLQVDLFSTVPEMYDGKISCPHTIFT